MNVALCHGHERMVIEREVEPCVAWQIRTCHHPPRKVQLRRTPAPHATLSCHAMPRAARTCREMHAPRRAASVDASTRARAARKITNKRAARSAPLRAPLRATRSAARWVLRTRAPRSAHRAPCCALCCALRYTLRCALHCTLGATHPRSARCALRRARRNATAVPRLNAIDFVLPLPHYPWPCD